MDDFLKHYNHNHDSLGRFSKSSAAKRTRAAKRGLNKLYKLDKKASKYYTKKNHNYYILPSERSYYYSYKYDGFLLKKGAKGKAEKYAKKLQERIGDEPIYDLNSKQLYAGRKYCMRFVR
jgi:hypothetical protein